MLIAVALSEEERHWRRLEKSLGVRWEIDELIGFSDSPAEKLDSNKEVQLPRSVNIPLSIAVAPQFYKSIIDEYKNKYKSMMETKLNSGGKKVTEIGNLSAEDARSLLTRIGPALAAIQPKGSED